MNDWFKGLFGQIPGGIHLKAQHLPLSTRDHCPEQWLQQLLQIRGSVHLKKGVSMSSQEGNSQLNLIGIICLFEWSFDFNARQGNSRGTLKQNVMILLARLLPRNSVCMESANSTSLENIFHRSWYRRCLESKRVTRTRASSSWKRPKFNINSTRYSNVHVKIWFAMFSHLTFFRLTMCKETFKTFSK